VRNMRKNEGRVMRLKGNRMDAPYKLFQKGDSSICKSSFKEVIASLCKQKYICFRDLPRIDKINNFKQALD